jgi:4-hydroxy-3-polyprenylbenzoate decarboxylase
MAGSFKDLRDLLAYFEKRGQLRRVRVEVSPDFELAEVTARAARLPGGGPALLFENVAHSNLPVLTNLFGSPQRLAWSFGLNRLAELEAVMEKLLRPTGPHDLGERLARLAETSHLARFAPRSLRSGPAQEVVRLGGGPELLEGLPFLTAGPSETFSAWRQHPVFNRPQPDGPVEVRAGSLVRQAEKLYLAGIKLQPGERRQVSLVVGGDPALLFAVNAPFLPELDPLLLAGALAGRRLELLRGKTNDLEVPAASELVLEGVIEASGETPTLRLGQWNGYSAPPEDLARFSLTALTSRKDPLLITPVVSVPPNEAGALVKGSERLLLPLLRQTAPEIADLCLPAAATFFNLAVVAIHKSYPGQAQRVMYSLWGQPRFKFLKHIVVVDADCPLEEPDRLIARILALLDPERDLLSVKGPLDFSDIASLQAGSGAKVGLDATRKLPGEVLPGADPIRQQPTASPAEVQKLVNRKWLEYGIE